MTADARGSVPAADGTASNLNAASLLRIADPIEICGSDGVTFCIASHPEINVLATSKASINEVSLRKAWLK